MDFQSRKFEIRVLSNVHFNDHNINKNENWKALTHLTLRCLAYMKGMFNPNVTWHSYLTKN